MTGTNKKRLAGLFTCLMFVLPYERIPSLAVHLFGTSIDLRLSFLVGAALIILVAWSLAFTAERLRVRIESFHYLLGAFFFIYLLSALVSTDLKRALTVWVFTAFTALVGLAVSFVWKMRDSTAMKRAFWITTWIVLAFGFYQYIGDVAGLSSSWTGLREIYTKEVFGFPRIQSVGLEPLFYGNFLLIPFFYFATRFLTAVEERPLFLLIITTQLFLTVSRGALIGGVSGLCLLLAFLFRRSHIQQKAGLIGVIVVGTGLALLLTNVNSFNVVKTNQSQTSTPPASAVISQATNLTSQDDRLRNRTLAWDAFKEHPLLGIGPGNFNQYAKDHYDGYRGDDTTVVVNNEPLEMLAEGGLLSFLALIAFAGVVVGNLVRIAIKGGDRPDLDWTYALLAYFVALAIQYQTFSTLYIMQVWVTLGIAMGIVAIKPAKTGSKPRLNKKLIKP